MKGVSKALTTTASAYRMAYARRPCQPHERRAPPQGDPMHPNSHGSDPAAPGTVSSGQSLRSLPDFAIIGAAKSATSQLANYLKRHPQIHFCAIKEPLFFAYEHLYERGLAEYAKRIRPSNCPLDTAPAA